MPADLTTSLPYPERPRYLSPSGYLQLYVLGCGLVLEHRLIMELHIGRPLADDEHIHHINGDTTDNRIENLQIINPSEHTRLHGTLYTQETLLHDLRELARRLNRVPQLLDCDLYPDLPSRHTYQRYFGTWRQAIALADLPFSTSKKWSRHYDTCIECGLTDQRHACKGRCHRCQERYKRKSIW